MAQTGRNGCDNDHHCGVGVSGCKSVGLYRPITYLGAGGYLSNRRHNMDFAVTAITHLDGNRIVQGTTRGYITFEEWRE